MDKPRFQFRLRALFAVMAIATVLVAVAAWAAAHREASRRSNPINNFRVGPK